MAAHNLNTMLSILIVNGDRFLINEASRSVDETCNTICSAYPDDAVIEFDTVQPFDIQRSTGPLNTQWI